MMPLPSKIIVTRFSAMGDVAMVASVLKEFCVQYPDVQLIMVSRPFFRAFFDEIPQITFHPFDPKGKHKGILGIRQLKQELDQYQATAVADLHYNLRSRILGFLFRLSGTRVVGLDKGRKEKKQLTRTVDKVLKPLRQTTERYADVFRKLGFTVHLSHTRITRKEQLPQMARAMFADEGTAKIGIAPFAQHPYKVFPLAKMGKVIQTLSEKGYETFIFGGGNEEKKIAAQWESQFRNVHNTIGLFTLKEELAIISNLNLMISMDSSGMHMASLMDIRCLSIWGATHPFAGFLGYGQVLEDCIQVDHPNRPGSVYGNKPCDCDGIEAIDLVTPEMVIDKIGISGI
ncbi:glycosyltransferase family 9 protein [Sphingobacterium spiritivorum]|uniref:glycosyltransferase family 9 protein n=1 Tax=Sphingobacterium spiritivorum TaxID=258 RepID=UPI003DA306C9